MFRRSKFGINCVIFFLASVSAKSKYYDGEIRPYEFGFKLEGNQHRHEKKDAKGLINGEFGFITADKTYHQTVYATDENGNFKLLSFRSSFNTIISTTTSPPTTSAPTTSPPITSPSTTSPPITSPSTTSPPTTSAPTTTIPLNSSHKSCSDCKVYEIEANDKLHSNDPTSVADTKNPGQVDHTNVPKITVKSKASTIMSVSPLDVALGFSTAGNKESEQIKLQHTERENTPSQQIVMAIHSIQETVPVSLQRNSETLSTEDNIKAKLSKTHLSSKKAIDNFIGNVLYRFNYTTGYHGHNEEGDRTGNKKGGYFIIGRDNIRRGVIYVANSNGFIPMIKYEKISSAEAPYDTENSAALKGYKFEWFHEGKSEIENSSGTKNR